MDRDAIARFIELTHERYAKELGDQLQEVTLFFTDEPQFGATEPWMYGNKEAVPAVQWCDELPRAFQDKKGYSVAEALPALYHDVGPETPRFRYDFYDVQSDLVAENYFGQIQDWCHQHGVWSSGHMLLEESLLLPETRMLHDATLNTVAAFLDGGGHVAFVGSLPRQNPVRGESPDMTAKAKMLLASAPERTRHVAEPDEFSELVAWMDGRVPPILRWHGPPSVRIMLRREPERDILLVANPSAEVAEGKLTAEFEGDVSMWDPETGTVDNVGWRTSGQAVAVRVPADSARFVVMER